ncbi:MAG: peptide chain release factor N(5)-glutamine methyltransferase [Clostridia bacterium]|nr:peptide chain release factor N(5)-glutamine methyltransferase [Clostridia bacterium]
MQIKELLNKGTIMLKTNGVESPKLKARLLLQHILNKTRQQMIIYDTEQVSKEKEKEYIININKLIKGIPLQHITNSQEFMKMNFFVNNDVLIPRADTEILVEEVIKIAKQKKNPIILDLCTGSGAIAVSLAKYIENAIIYAVDISENALKVAQRNAKENNVEQKIKFIKSDMFAEIKQEVKFDIIVSNPPYIRTDVIKQLNKDVQNEPHIALDGGKDGLDFYRKIAKEAYTYMKIDSFLCLEIGYDQKIDVIEIIENEKKYATAYCKKDLYGNDRIIVTKILD